MSALVVAMEEGRYGLWRLCIDDDDDDDDDGADKTIIKKIIKTIYNAHIVNG